MRALLAGQSDEVVVSQVSALLSDINVKCSSCIDQMITREVFLVYRSRSVPLLWFVSCSLLKNHSVCIPNLCFSCISNLRVFPVDRHLVFLFHRPIGVLDISLIQFSSYIAHVACFCHSYGVSSVPSEQCS